MFIIGGFLYVFIHNLSFHQTTNITISEEYNLDNFKRFLQ